MILADSDRIVSLTLKAQERIFRLAARDHGLSLKAISLDAGIPYSTLRTYASAEAVMPIPAVLKLCDVVPDHLLSQIFDPVGRHIAPNETEDGDLAELGREAAGFTAEFVEAISDGKVTPMEHTRLAARAGRLKDAAEKVSAA